MASVGSLVADLKLESAAFVRDLGKASQAVATNTARMRKDMRALSTATAGIAKQFDQLRTAAAAFAGALAVRQFTAFTQAAIETNDALAKQAQRLDISAQALQRLRIEGQLAGVSIQQVDGAAASFTKRVGELRAGTGSLATFLDKTNTSLKNQLLAARSSGEAMQIMLKAINQAPGSFDKVALSAAAFGRTAGTSMVLLARDIGTVDDQMAKLVSRSDEVLKASEHLDDQLTLLQAAYSAGFDSSIIESLTGSIEASGEAMKDARTLGEQFGKVVGESMKAVAEVAKLAADNLGLIGSVLAGLIAYKAAAVFLSLAAATAKWVTALVAAQSAMATLGAILAANPIGAIAVAVGAATAALIYFKDQTISVGDTTTTVSTLIRGAWSEVVGVFRGLGAVVASVGTALATVLSGNPFDASKWRAALEELSTTASRFREEVARTRAEFDTMMLAEQTVNDFAAIGRAWQDARKEIETAATGTGVAVSEQTKKITESTEALRLEAEQTGRLVVAMQGSQAAYDAVNAEIKIQNEALKLGVDMTTEQGKAWFAAARQASVLAEQLKVVTDAKKQSDAVQDSTDELRRQADQMERLTVAYQQGEVAYKGVTREVEVQNAAVKLGVDLTTDQGKAWYQAAMQAQLLEDGLDDLKTAHEKATQAAKEQAEEARRLSLAPFKNAIEGIQGAFSDLFENIFSGGVDSFSDLGKAIKGIFVKLAAEIAALLVFKPIVLQLAGATGLGGLLSLAGGAAPAAASSPYRDAAMAAASSSSGGFSLTGLLGSSQLGALTTDIAASLGFGGTGQMIAGNIGAGLPGIFAGSGLASLLGIGGGTAGNIGGTIGGILGTLTPLGPLGGAIGGFLGSTVGKLFGGLFGGGIKRQTGGATVNAATGALISSGAKASTPDAAIQLAGQAQQIIRAFADITGANVAGRGLAVRIVANADDVNESPFTLFRRGYGQGGIDFKTSEDLLQQGVLEILRDPSRLTGIPKEYLTALKNATSAEDLLNQAQAIKDVLDARKAETAAAKEQARQLAEQRRERDRQNMIAIRASQAQSAGTIVDFLRSQSLSPDSSLNPTARLTEAQRQFGGFLRQVRGGDLGATSALTQSAGTLLGIGRENFASTVDFANLERFVRSSLLSVANEVTSGAFYSAQIEATRQQTDVLSDDLKTVNETLRQVKKEIVLLRQQAA